MRKINEYQKTPGGIIAAFKYLKGCHDAELFGAVTGNQIGTSLNNNDMDSVKLQEKNVDKRWNQWNRLPAEMVDFFAAGF